MARIALFAPLALLAACGDKDAENDERSASGEVLEGTISDSMLPLDKLQSQPPLMEEVGEESGSDAGQANSAPEAATEGGSEPAEAAEPQTFDEAFGEGEN